ncbi:Na+/H+ antiporter subunit D [Plantactinospora soyae]|uniref:Multicomponent Na+:H+ antiporter subunit D n=1 Tax=Plantactinospora soyae TaxID=1544732 RepID=A0A927QZV1_9ACTN|nr:Na+/H+ antiporter subunit D [Plantactinospora soyae]MBE1487978.1 multicomponent Na+:H+ antiporter subunit D [Plantactinospora soyae]
MNFLVPLPVVVPLLGAALTLILIRRPILQRAISVAVLVITLTVAILLLWHAYRDGPLVVYVGEWPAPLGIVLVADQLAALMLVASAAVTLCVLLYSIGEGRADPGQHAPVVIYHPTYLVLTAGVTNAFLSGDLFNLFVGFEILLAASYVLLTLGGTEERIRAGTTYVVVSLLSSMIFLTAIGLVYAATGTLNLAQLVHRLDGLPAELQLVLHFMLLLAFGIKAAVFPLSAWLPDSYPTAPAPVTAVFAGLLTKVGVYAIIRTETLLFPDGRAAEVLLMVALLTMLVGILGAVAQSDIKRLLSFTLVSHIGYMLFGIALTSAAGLAGAIFYVVHHITVQTTLFLAAGLVERRAGSTNLDRIGGLARTAPLLGLLFFLPALSLAGVPPFSGFLGKLGLLQAGVAAGGVLAWLLVAGGTLTSLLTLYATTKVWNLAFWRSPRTPDPEAAGGRRPANVDEAKAPDRDSAGGQPDRDSAGGQPDPGAAERLPRLMVWATVALVVLGLGLTVAAGPLFGVSAEAAEDLRQRTPYVDAVFPGGAP